MQVRAKTHLGHYDHAENFEVIAEMNSQDDETSVNLNPGESERHNV